MFLKLQVTEEYRLLLDLHGVNHKINIMAWLGLKVTDCRSIGAQIPYFAIKRRVRLFKTNPRRPGVYSGPGVY